MISVASFATTSPVFTATRRPVAPDGAALLLGERAEGVLHRDGGAHGADRVVLGHARDAEHRLHAVAEQLRDRAAVRLDGAAHRRVVATP